MKKFFTLTSALLLPLTLLTGCNMVVMAPSGDIATQQRDLILLSTGLMLIIIVPVIFLSLYFFWKYRATNTAATYRPNWDHSTRLEVIIWSAPVAIILVLGTVTWFATHRLDPYRPLDRIDARTPIAADVKPLTVQVVAMDWKWLFIYPDQGIATVNELAAPVNVPINFQITSQSVMNSFYVPALAGQIYAMPGMQTKLHGVINKEGVYDGFSANYSGAGFSHMRFKFHGLDQAGLDTWVERVKSQGTALNRDTYMKLEKPSEREPVRYFAANDKALFNNIINLCTDPGKMCQADMMHTDMLGGSGKDSVENREKLEYDNRGVDLSLSPKYYEGKTGEVAKPEAKAAPASPLTSGEQSRNDTMPGMTMPDTSNGNKLMRDDQPRG